MVESKTVAAHQSWRSAVRHTLDSTDTLAGQLVNGAIATLIFLSAAIFVAGTYPLPPALHYGLKIIDWLVLGGFTLEYLVRLWVSIPFWRYPISLYGLIDLVSILPFIFGFLDIRFLKLLRWLRILRLVRFLDDQPWLGRITRTDTLIFIRILSTLAIIIFIYSGLIFQVENPRNPEVFSNFLDAVYFAIVTVTTVGYGDVTPISEGGRLLTVMMILTGVALVPTQLSNLILQANRVSNTVYNPCPRCQLTLHDPDAQYCKRCGAALDRAASTSNDANLND